MNIWSGGSVNFWHSCCGGWSADDDYDDFWMKRCYNANFWPRHRILKVKKRKMIRISPGIYLWRLNCTLTLFRAAGSRYAPLSHIRVYTRVYAYIRANFFWQFLMFSVEEGTTLSTQLNCTIFPGKYKVGQFYSIFIRGDPYEPQRPPKKVTFSDHYLGWF